MSLEQIFCEIETRSAKFIDRLREAVEIPSISAEPEHRHDIQRMIDWTEQKLIALGAKCEQVENGSQVLADGTTLKLPPVLFATLGTDKNKKTLLVYGHLDVQPANKADGWNTEPFQLVEKDGKLYGRGATDDKGPVIAWLNAIEVLQDLKVDLPVNIKFVLEGMEESGSEGLDDILIKRRDDFLHDVDATCISDNYWLGKTKPCLTYGLRGVCYYTIDVSSPKQDLHSGVYGGSIHEPMNALVKTMSSLTDIDGNILIDGLGDLVAPLTDEEKKLYQTIDFDVESYCSDLGVKKLVSNCPQKVLMNRWRYPSLSLHGIEGAFYGSGAKTVIPARVIGKFSIRIVPNMLPEDVDRLVVSYVEKVWGKLGSHCTMKVTPLQGGRPWVADFKNSLYQAGARAQEKVLM